MTDECWYEKFSFYIQQDFNKGNIRFIVLLSYSIFIILDMMFYSKTNFLPPNYKVLQKLPWKVHFESSCGFCLVCLYARNILERDLCEQLFIII